MTHTLPGDLTDPEWAALDRALDGHASWLDGYLAGVALQPEPPSGKDWLHAVLGASADPQHQALCQRRLGALSEALRSQAWWDPFLRIPEADAVPALSQQLAPWVAGFDQALQDHPLAAAQDDPALMMVLARLYRHLPAHDPQEQALVDLLDQTQPLHSLEDAVDELTACVAELWDLTRPAPPV